MSGKMSKRWSAHPPWGCNVVPLVERVYCRDIPTVSRVAMLVWGPHCFYRYGGNEYMLGGYTFCREVKGWDYVIKGPLTDLHPSWVNPVWIFLNIWLICREIGTFDARDFERDKSGTHAYAAFLVELSEKVPALMVPNISLLMPLLNCQVSRYECHLP